MNEKRIFRLEERMRAQPANVRYLELMKVCEHHVGKPRQQGSSHAVF